MPEDFIVVLVTAKDRPEAEKIAQTLIEERLVACANIVEGVRSCYVWHGKTESATECLVLFKSRKTLFSELAQRVKQLHSYEVPEVLALPVLDGSKDYLEWLNSNLKS